MSNKYISQEEFELRFKSLNSNQDMQDLNQNIKAIIVLATFALDKLQELKVVNSNTNKSKS